MADVGVSAGCHYGGMGRPFPIGQPRTSARGRDVAPVSVTALVLRFAAAGAVALIVLALATAFISRQVGRGEAVSDARRVAWINGQGVVGPALEDAVVDMDPEALRKVDKVVRDSVLKGSLVRVKLWRADGTIIYSDEGRLVGTTYELGEDERRVFETGVVEAEISDLSNPENRFESPSRELLEVYLPVETPNGTRLLFEAYFLNDGVSNAGRRVWTKFAPITLGSLVLLQLVQIPLAWSMARHLRRGQDAREQLLQHAIDSSDAERRRIAGDLHDGVVQDISGVSYALAAVARQNVVPPDSRDTISDAAGQLRESVRSLRSLLVEIYPPNLQEEGLEPVISDLLARLEGRGIDTTLRSDLPPGYRYPERVAALLYRTTQEALRNIVAHADASCVSVHLSEAPQKWTLRVEDDGRGFDPTRAGVVTGSGHVGLRVVADLINEMGGTLSVESAPSAGTIVLVEVPQR